MSNTSSKGFAFASILLALVGCSSAGGNEGTPDAHAEAGTSLDANPFGSPFGDAAFESTSNGGTYQPVSSTATYPALTDPTAAYPKYCTGKLLRSFGLSYPAGPGTWMDDGTRAAAAGATFIVTADFQQYGGVTFLASGGVVQIDASSEYATGLIPGTDFTSSCLPTPTPSEGTFVVLAPSTLYSTAAMNGAPCKVAAGASFTIESYEFGALGLPGAFVSEDLQAICGFTSAYSNDLVFGYLVAR